MTLLVHKVFPKVAELSYFMLLFPRRIKNAPKCMIQTYYKFYNDFLITVAITA